MTDFVVGAEQLSAFVLVIMSLWLVVTAWRGKTLPSAILQGWRASFEAGMEKPAVSWWRSLLCWGWMFVAYMYVMDFYIWELGMLAATRPDTSNIGGQYAFDVGGYIMTVNLTVTQYSLFASLVNAILATLIVVACWNVIKNGLLGAWRIIRLVVLIVLWVFTFVFSLGAWPFEVAWKSFQYRQQMRKLRLENMVRDIANQAIRDAKVAGTVCSGAHGAPVPVVRGGLSEARVKEIVEGVVHTELDEYDRKVGGFVVMAIAALVKQGSLKIPDPSATTAHPIFRHRPSTPGGS